MNGKPYVYRREPREALEYIVRIVPTGKEWMAFVYSGSTNVWTSPKRKTFLGACNIVDKWFKGNAING